VRYPDIVRDEPRIPEQWRQEASSHYLNTLSYPTPENIGEQVELFKKIKPLEKGFAKLLGKFPVFMQAFQQLPEPVRQSTIKWTTEMVNGFYMSDLQDIGSIKDYYRRAHYDAGVVGYIITDDFMHRGYISQETRDKLMPDPKSEKLGVNLANDVGVALQYANDIGDIWDDIRDGIYKWPRILLQAQGLDYSSIPNLDLSSEHDRAKGNAILEELVSDAKPIIISSCKYVEEMPQDPNGLRNFLNFTIALSAMKLRNSYGLMTPERKIPKDLGEIDQIFHKVREIGEQGGDALPFIQHTLERPAQEFSQ
jgi:phytoene/squalene synthetase